MPRLGNNLDLPRCPYCNVDQPNLVGIEQFQSTDFRGDNRRFWRNYRCERCGGIVTAAARGGWDQEVAEYYPKSTEVDIALPQRAREYLQQALNSLHSPAGAVMLAASAVDAMLKAKGYKEGSLFNRIDKAVADHLITEDMGKWAHQVRLDANDQRHADEAAPLPTPEDAHRILAFASALGQFLFVLPAKVQKGLEEAKPG